MMSSFSNTSYYQDVREWLKKLFGNEEIPDFEETDEIMQILKRTMLKNKEAERDIQEIIKTEKKHTEIYKNKADEICSILNAEPLDLNSETIKTVEDIAALGVKLNLKEPTITNFLFAIIEAENKEMEAKEIKLIGDYHLESLSKKLTEVMKTNDILRRELDMLEKTVAHQEAYKPQVLSHSSFLDTKIEDYKLKIKKYEEDLTKRNFDSSLEHNHLTQRAESIKELEKELRNLHLQLNSYQSLPANESLTRLKIQTARSELAALEEQFQKLMESVSGACDSDSHHV